MLASGAHDWENRFEDGYWTYHLDDAWAGVQDAYAKMAAEVKEKTGETLTTIGALGFSAMMHGYLPFDEAGNQLAGFRTWRNTTRRRSRLRRRSSELFHFNIPQRWSVAHLYQGDPERRGAHVQDRLFDDARRLSALEADGPQGAGRGRSLRHVPIDSETGTYDADMLAKFDAIVAPGTLAKPLVELLPEVLSAGEDAGFLTEEGAKLLDPTGALKPRRPDGSAGGRRRHPAWPPRTAWRSARAMCPPARACFAMVVLEKQLSTLYPEIDMVTTPTGKPVAMVHCNTCTSDLDAWVRLLGEMAAAAGAELKNRSCMTCSMRRRWRAIRIAAALSTTTTIPASRSRVWTAAVRCSCAARTPKLTLANFARVQLYSAMADAQATAWISCSTRKTSRWTRCSATAACSRRRLSVSGCLAGALNVPVAVMETAGEGGPWGMAPARGLTA